MREQHSYHNDISHKSLSKKTTDKLNRHLKQSSLLISVLPLAACSGNKAEPDFIKTQSNVFTARDDAGRTLLEGSNTENLRVTGGKGNDLITTGSGNDSIIGGDGDDILNGGDGDDFIYGHPGADIIDGGAGDDFINGNAGADILDGGDGIDMLSYHESPSAVNINLAANTASGGDAQGDTINNFENVTGSYYDDIIIGDDQDNYLSGGSFLGASSGNDTLIGGGGDDVLFVGPGGQDILNGGSGDDMFIFEKIYSHDPNAIDTFDGGTGIDTLFFRDLYPIVRSFDFDFSMINASNIEILDFTYNGVSKEDNITLTLTDILDVTDGNNQLRIDGDANDSVTSTGQNWVQGADQIIDGENYHVYGVGGATLLIDDDITQTIT